MRAYLTILLGQKVYEKQKERGTFGFDVSENLLGLKVLFPAQYGA